MKALMSCKLTPLEIEELRGGNQDWLAPLNEVSLDDVEAAANAIMKATQHADPGESRRRAAWLCCWLLAVRRRAGPWRVASIKDPNGTFDYCDFFESCAVLLSSLRCDVTLECFVKDDCAYACLLTRDQLLARDRLQQIFLVTLVDKPLLAYSAPVVLRRRLAASMDAAVAFLPVNYSKQYKWKRLNDIIVTEFGSKDRHKDPEPSTSRESSSSSSSESSEDSMSGYLVNYDSKDDARMVEDSPVKKVPVDSANSGASSRGNSNGNAPTPVVIPVGEQRFAVLPQGPSQPGPSRGNAPRTGLIPVAKNRFAALPQDLSQPGPSRGNATRPVVIPVGPKRFAVLPQGPSQPRPSRGNAPTTGVIPVGEKRIAVLPQAPSQPGPSRGNAPITGVIPVGEKRIAVFPQGLSQPGPSRGNAPRTGHIPVAKNRFAVHPEDLSQPGPSRENAPRPIVIPVGEQRFPLRPQGPSQPGPPRAPPNREPADDGGRKPADKATEALYKKVCEEIPGLSKSLADIQGRCTFRGRKLKSDKMCKTIDEYCANTARDENKRKEMLDAIRKMLAVKCSKFVWNEETGKLPFTPTTRKSGASRRPAVETNPLYSALQTFWNEGDPVPSFKEQMKRLLENTYKQRISSLRQVKPLPNYFCDEDILCKEAELRFGAEMGTMEEKLGHAVRIFSEHMNRECTIREFCDHLADPHLPSLIAEIEVRDIHRDCAPYISTREDGMWIDCGARKEVVSISSRRLERALILCLAMYYIKDLAYPAGYDQVLYVLQCILFPSDPLPKVRKSDKICSVLELFMEKGVIRKHEPVWNEEHF